MPKTVVFFGDSLTAGTVGAAYLERLRKPLAGVRLINAGVNGDTVLHLLRRVKHDVLRRQPDVVVIEVGLNDLGSAYGEPSIRRYYRTLKQLDQQVSPHLFAAAYQRLLAIIQQHSRARIAVCTPTTLGEQPAAPVQPYIDAYAHIVRALALRERLALIDLRRVFLDAIAAEPRDGPPYRIWQPLGDNLAIALGRQTHDTLGAQRNYRLLCDGVHLTATGAALVANTMLPVLRCLLG